MKDEVKKNKNTLALSVYRNTLVIILLAKYKRFSRLKPVECKVAFRASQQMKKFWQFVD